MLRAAIKTTCFVFFCLVYSGFSQVVITIDDSTTYQTMHGFGAALTESSAYIFQNYLGSSERLSILQELFSTNTGGIGLNYVRLPIGSSDFRLADFTCDDVSEGQTDYDLSSFSIDRDLQWTIPTLQSMYAINTNLLVMATPWSPPAWMKDNENLFRGSLKSSCHNVYSQYLMKFIQAYATNGIPITTLTLQNEPLYASGSYPGAIMSATQQIALAQTVYQLFTDNGITTKLLCFDHNWSDYAYPNTVLSNTAAHTAFAGTAFHGYEGSVTAQSRVHNAHPDKEIHFSEISSGSWETDFAQNLIWDVSTLIIQATRNWAQSILKWNITLNSSGGPKINGGCDTCRGVVTIDSNGSITRNHDYYALAHASRFVRPGAVRIASSDNSSRSPITTAFKNPDNTIVLIAVNVEESKQYYRFKWDNQSYSYPLPARSVATFVWSDTSGATVNAWITTGDKTKLLEQQNDPGVFSPTTINWKGYDWTVRDYDGNPGDNHWAADCVWVDNNDNLHLAMKYRQGTWYCGEVLSHLSPQHGIFDWYLQGRPDLLDSNTVGGLFLYHDTTHEIDIEFARAFAPGNSSNLLYTIQPYNISGHQHFESVTFSETDTRHRIEWHPQCIAWESRYGTPQSPSGTVISAWNYSGYDVPEDNNEKIFMNIWKFQNPPTDTNHVELVICDFKYTPFSFGATIEPQGVLEAGAQWRINNGSWISGGKAFDLPAGIYTVECAATSGWIEPDPVTYVLTNNATRFITLTYTAMPQTPETFTFNAFALTNNIILRWKDPRLCGFTNRNVLIRYSNTDYPDSQSDGTHLYQGPNRYLHHSDLTPGQTCYYTIWTTQDGVNFVIP